MRKWLFAALLLITGACETQMPHKSAEIDFNGPVYTLNVSEINVSDDYQTSKRLPHVEGLSDITPAKAIRQWVSRKLVAGGNGSRAEVSIKDAHIIKKEIPKEKTGVEGYFTAEQTEQYDGGLKVEVKIYDGAHILPVASVSASSQNMRTLSEDATIIDREALYHDMSVELVNTILPELDKNIRENFPKYLMQ